MKENYWQKKDGSYVHIDTIDVNHLRNILKMIVRNNIKVTKSSNISNCHLIEDSIAYNLITGE